MSVFTLSTSSTFIFGMLWSSLINLAALTVAEAHLNVHNSHLEVRDATLQVTLEPVLSDRVAEVSATIKNSGSSDLNLLKVGTILDDKLPVQRVLIADDLGRFSDERSGRIAVDSWLGNHVPFRGIEPSIRYDALRPSHFQLLPAGESLNITIDPAKVHLFEKSGTYSVTAQGLIPAALAPLTDFSHPAIAFKSNTVSIEVDADAAASRLVTAALVERTNLQPGCNETTLDASTKGLSNCQALALAAAADAADPASKRFVEYFRTNSSEARDVVVARFRSVAEECGTTDTGVSRYFCYDYYGICEIEGPLNAYTLWQFNTVVMCPLFYGLPPLPVGCHRQCQATTTIHEITHCEGVYAPHTNDYAYAYNASVALPLERALLNADNYSLYANAVYMKC